jgi:protein gp37
MGENSKIEWCDHTWNGWWGCQKVSPGCEHCYAETFSKRVGRNIWGPAKTTERWRTQGPWHDIRKWDAQAKREGVRRRVFCQSMSDFFEDHPQVAPWRKEAFGLLESLEWLDVQLLTKRIENVRRMVPASWLQSWPAHVWMGTSVEDQVRADERIPHLLQIPAPVRFVSAEPLLGPVDLGHAIPCGYYCDEAVGHVDHPFWTPGIASPIQWVIVGGESGPHARPFHVEWGVDLMSQCADAGIAFFWKQMGDHLIDRHGERIRLKAAKGSDWAEWPEELRVREFPETD